MSVSANNMAPFQWQEAFERLCEDAAVLRRERDEARAKLDAEQRTSKNLYITLNGALEEKGKLAARVKVLEDALTRIANTTEGDADLDEYGAAEVARKALEGK